MTDSDTHDPQNDIDLLMEQEGRILLEARMLPTEGPLNKAERLEVREAANAYIKKHKLFKKTVASQLGLPDSVVIQVLNDSYNANPDKHLRALNDWMEVDARRRRGVLQGTFVETRVAKRLLGCAEHASQDRCMAVAYGPTGIGKSMVAKVLVERFPGTVYIRLSSGNISYTALRNMLATRLKATRRTKDNRGLTADERIFAKLRDSNRMIIVDEAHRLSQSGLDFLRDIWDECRVPMLLLCCKDLADRIRKDADADHGQLVSRIGFWCPLTRGFDDAPGGSNPLFTLGEIRKLFERGKIRFASETRAYLQDIACALGDGSLRLVEDILRSAIPLERAVQKLGREDPVVVTLDAVLKAHADRRPDDHLLEELTHRHARRGTAKTGS